MRRLAAILALALTLCACAEFPPPMPPETIAPADADAGTLTAMAAHETLPPETMPPEPEPPPIALPESVDTNITDKTARALVADMAALADEWSVAISYISGDGAWYASVNGGEVFPSASTIKPMYCQYLIEAGVDMAREITHNVTLNRTSITGRFTEDALGERFTVEELMRAAVGSSDNMAYRILFSAFGRWGYNAWAEEIGVPELIFPTPYEFLDVTAPDLSRGMLAILQRDGDGVVAGMMKDADRKVQIAAGTRWECASKYGFEGWTLGYHDTAIVYAPAPYVLTVMSHIFAYDTDADVPFEEAARLADAVNAALFE